MSPWVEIEDEPKAVTGAIPTGVFMEVRRRDGDNCRYCGCRVNFQARKSARAGAYCRVDRGLPVGVDNVAVMCAEHGAARPHGDDRRALLRVPARPVYAEFTRRWLGSPVVEVFPVLGEDIAGDVDLNPALSVEIRVDGLLAGGVRELVVRVVELEVEGRRPADDQVGPPRTDVIVALEREGNHVVSRQALDDDVLDASKIPSIHVVLQHLGSNSDRNVSHESSPSVGAPCGAGCGSSNPTDGEPLPAGGTPTPSVGSTPSTPRPAAPGLTQEQADKLLVLAINPIEFLESETRYGHRSSFVPDEIWGKIAQDLAVFDTALQAMVTP